MPGVEPVYNFAVPLARAIRREYPAFQTDQFSVLVIPPPRAAAMLGAPLVWLLAEEVTLPGWGMTTEVVTFPMRVEYPTAKGAGDGLSVTFGENTAFFVHRFIASWWQAMWDPNGGMNPPDKWKGSVVVILSQGLTPIAYTFARAFPKGMPALALSYTNPQVAKVKVEFGFQRMDLIALTSYLNLTR